MKYITLAGGQSAVVDDSDYEVLIKWKWRLGSSGYPARRNSIANSDKPTWITMHRLIMEFPVGQVDHINGDKLDNRRCNLRLCTHKENHRNNRVKAHRLYKGISWSKREGMWRATITVNQKFHYIGYFRNPRHAAMAYDIWATFFFNEFACTNFKPVTSN